MITRFANYGKVWIILSLVLITAGARVNASEQVGENKPVAVASDMILVEGGTFLMGDTFGDGEPEEQPVHQVTLRSFYIGKYEVTNQEYAVFCLETARNGGWATWNCPAIYASWYDAVSYCNWRSEREGLQPAYSGTGKDIVCNFTANGYRLPTEAEWEYAARGGKESRGYMYSGSNLANEVGWYDFTYGHPIGQKRGNELGIYDMSGNVWEWCWDWYGEYDEDDVENPQGPSTGIYRLYRGGGWGYQSTLRVSQRSRAGYTPDRRVGIIGFRLAKTFNVEK